MKTGKKFHWGLPALTLVLVIAGALLPYAASRLQDAYTLKNLGAMMVEPMTITLQQDEVELSPLLRLLSEERFVRLEWNGETALTSSEVINIATDFFRLLKEEELISFEEIENTKVSPAVDFAVATAPLSFVMSPVYMGGEEEGEGVAITLSPFLYVSEDGEFSAVVWECSFLPGNQAEYSVYLDDSSGKAVKVNVRSPYLDFRMQDSPLIAMLQAERWRSFCEEYYNIDMLDCQPVYSTETSMRFRMTAKLSEKQAFAISLTIYENYTAFH